ncbi:hypothetical protein MiSe_57750 [Microseira wollei NIES-4236]|uniref:Uncharacterized protein n=1 Tax=Microseira wollei NIES-4236 TaxID=2530354 RepID=A0AAV3XHG9_9CYAN|nr:hypothetical protein MiSe_57750 [Microseira wollei NIES-4236]
MNGLFLSKVIGQTRPYNTLICSPYLPNAPPSSPQPWRGAYPFASPLPQMPKPRATISVIPQPQPKAREDLIEAGAILSYLEGELSPEAEAAYVNQN